MYSLFREKAVLAAHAPIRGTALRARQPAWTTILFTVALAVGLATVGSLFVRYNQHIRVEGSLMPSSGLLSIDAPHSGTVVDVMVRRSQRVEPGQSLIEISAERIEANAQTRREQERDSLIRELSEVTLKWRIEKSRLDADRDRLSDRIDSLLADHRALANERQFDRQRIELAERGLPGLRQLRERGLISAFQLQDHEARALELRSDAQARSRQQRALDRELSQVRQELAELPDRVAIKIAEHERRQADLEARIEGTKLQNAHLLRSPVDAEIVEILAEPGTSLTVGTTVMLIAPANAKLVAVVLVPAEAVARPKPGDRAVVRFTAFPYQRFGHLSARVVDVSATPLSAEQLTLTGVRTQSGGAFYRISLKLDSVNVGDRGSLIELRPGMRLEADLQLGYRHLFEAILPHLELADSGPTEKS